MIKSNFREFINYGELFHLVADSGDEYWHGFQHGIGLIGHAAPLVWRNDLKTLYIASSFTIKSKGVVTCASDPTIDNYVRMAGCKTVHDQYEFERQQKVDNICEYIERMGTPLNLRVCWITSGGENCCKCEKCLRTMFEIFGAGHDPHDYGFNYTENHLKLSKFRVLDGYNFINRPMWKEIQERFNSSSNCLALPEIEWIKTINLDNAKSGSSYQIYRYVKLFKTLPGRLFRKLKRIISKN